MLGSSRCYLDTLPMVPPFAAVTADPELILAVICSAGTAQGVITFFLFFVFFTALIIIVLGRARHFCRLRMRLRSWWLKQKKSSAMLIMNISTIIGLKLPFLSLVCCFCWYYLGPSPWFVSWQPQSLLQILSASYLSCWRVASCQRESNRMFLNIHSSRMMLIQTYNNLNAPNWLSSIGIHYKDMFTVY